MLVTMGIEIKDRFAEQRREYKNKFIKLVNSICKGKVVDKWMKDKVLTGSKG